MQSSKIKRSVIPVSQTNGSNSCLEKFGDNYDEYLTYLESSFLFLNWISIYNVDINMMISDIMWYVHLIGYSFVIMW